MIGFIANKEIDVFPYFEALKFQAEYGNHAPHKDGWGYASYKEDEFNFKKSLKPIWKDAYSGPLKSETALLHARQASPSTPLTYQNAHPFVFQLNGKIWSFVHNGSIKNIPQDWGEELDSKIYANLLEEELKKGNSLIESAKKVVEKIRTKCEITAVNAFLATSDQFLAIRYSDESHMLFYHVDENIFEISTEPVREDWIEMKNPSMILSERKKGKIEFQILKL
jgi:predicted glutamine amidotransferase